MANKFKLSKKQVNKLARENVCLRADYNHLYSEITYLIEQQRDRATEHERLLTECEQLRTGMDAIVELARGNA